jgi:hypothetical protein
MTEVASSTQSTNSTTSVATSFDDPFALGLRQIFAPIARECEARLAAVVSAQQSLIAQMKLLDTGLFQFKCNIDVVFRGCFVVVFEKTK